MKANLKLTIGLAGVLIFNALLRLVIFHSTPNSVSPEEIAFLKTLTITPALNDLSFRFLALPVNSLMLVLITLLVYRTSKNLSLSLITALLMTIVPWSFILQQHLNPFILLPLGVVTVLMVSARPVLRLAGIGLVVFLLRHWLDLHLPSVSQSISDFPILFRLVDWKTLFFAGDSVSQYLKIPKAGFFFYGDSVFLFLGAYRLLDSRFKQLTQTVLFLFIVGMLFLFTTSANALLTYRGILLFLPFTLIGAVGYHYALTALPRYLKLGAVAFMVINLIFVAELFASHFDKKNSFEWGYAETSAINQLNRMGVRCVYITQESGKFQLYADFYHKNRSFSVEKISDSHLKQTCLVNNQCRCLLKEQELRLVDQQKDDVQTVFSLYRGLPIYFLISKDNESK
ncbi:hypothetical protein M1523_02285 [Patescibacteria group bacterium]|nr:hypothetical protein [Patescibacteria group bacterium]MCL5091451.1 hypothetical protein [Patescibacteria group bacterium]